MASLGLSFLPCTPGALKPPNFPSSLSRCLSFKCPTATVWPEHRGQVSPRPLVPTGAQHVPRAKNRSWGPGPVSDALRKAHS